MIWKYRIFVQKKYRIVNLFQIYFHNFYILILLGQKNVTNRMKRTKTYCHNAMSQQMSCLFFFFNKEKTILLRIRELLLFRVVLVLHNCVRLCVTTRHMSCNWQKCISGPCGDHGYVGWERVTRKWFSFLCLRGEMKYKKQAIWLKFKIWNWGGSENFWN